MNVDRIKPLVGRKSPSMSTTNALHCVNTSLGPMYTVHGPNQQLAWDCLVESAAYEHSACWHPKPLRIVNSSLVDASLDRGGKAKVGDHLANCANRGSESRTHTGSGGEKAQDSGFCDL